MPTVKQLYDHMVKLEEIDQSEGAYPIYFNNDLAKVKFVLYCRYRNFLKKVKKLCHL